MISFHLTGIATVKLRTLGTLFIFLATASGFCAQVSAGKLATFQKFVNGEVPIKEAVVLRQISGPNGYLNKEWCRFGYQNDSWYVQRLVPSATNSSVLIPVESSICGASFSELWVVSDKNLHVAIKNAAKGSVPDEFGSVSRGLISEALSLGVPRENYGIKIPKAPIAWDGLKFNTTVESKWDKSGNVLATAPLKGQLKLGDNGLPSSAEFVGANEHPARSVTYEYAPDTSGIPKAFALKDAKETFRYEFLSLTLGTNDLTMTGGYKPSLFVDMTLERVVTFYTNEFGYNQRDGGSYPSFRPSAPQLGAPPPELQGTNWFNTPTPLTLASLRGKVVLLDFWAVQCVPCILALPHTQALYDKFKNEGLVVIGVCSDWGSEKDARRIFTRNHYTFPNLMDANLAIADMQGAQTARNYVLNAGIPAYALIDRSGNLAWKSTLEEMPSESQIKDLLERSPGKLTN